MPRPKKLPLSLRAAGLLASKFGPSAVNAQVYQGYYEYPDTQLPRAVLQQPRRELPVDQTNTQREPERSAALQSEFDFETAYNNKVAAAQFIANVLPTATYGGHVYEQSQDLPASYYSKPFTNSNTRRQYIINGAGKLAIARDLYYSRNGKKDPAEEERKRLAAEWIIRYSNFKNEYYKDTREKPLGLYAPAIMWDYAYNKVEESGGFDDAQIAAKRAADEDWARMRQEHPEYVESFRPFSSSAFYNIAKAPFDFVGGLSDHLSTVRNQEGEFDPANLSALNMRRDTSTQDAGMPDRFDRLNLKINKDDSVHALLNAYTVLGSLTENLYDQDGNILEGAMFEQDPRIKASKNEIETALRLNYGINIEGGSPWGGIKISNLGENLLDGNNNVVTQQQAILNNREDTWRTITNPQHHIDQARLLLFDSLPFPQQAKIMSDAASRDLDYANQLTDYQMQVAKAEDEAGYFKSAFNSYLSKLNAGQAEGFLGDINVERERLQNLNAIEEYYRCLNIVQNPNQYPREYVEQANNIVKKGASQIQHYVNWWNDQLAMSFGKNNPASLISNVWFSKDWGGRSIGDAAGAAGLHELVIDQSKNPAEILKDIDRYKQLSLKYIDDRLEGYNVNMAESEDHKKNISSYFTLKEQLASGNIFDIDNWLYRMPGLMGYSSSSWLKTGLSEAAAVVGGLLTSESGGWGYLAVKGATLPMAYSAGVDEASINVSQNVGQRFKKNLLSVGLWNEFKQKMSDQYNINPLDEDLMLNAYMAGDRVAGNNIQELYGDALHGVARSRQQDVAATTMDSFVELAVAASAIKGLPKSISKNLGDGIITKTIAPANPLLAAATRPADKLLMEAGAYQLFQEKIPTRLFGKKFRSKISKLASQVNPANYLSQKTYSNLKWLGDAVGRSVKTKIGAGYSEAIEEGKQQVIQEKFINGDYDWLSAKNGIFSSSIILEDINSGLDIARIALGIPLGIEHFEDAEKIENMKGGFMGGGTHMGVSSIVMSVADFNTQRKLNRDIAKYVDLQKQGIRGEIKAAEGISKLSKYGVYDISQAIDRVRSYYDGRGDEASVKAVDEKKDWLLRVAQYAKNPAIKKAAEKQGISKNSDEYDTYVALIASHQIRRDESLRDHSKLREDSRIAVNKKINQIFGEMDEQGIYRPDHVSASIIRSIIGSNDVSASGAHANYESSDLQTTGDQNDNQSLSNQSAGFTEEDKAKFAEKFRDALALAALGLMHDEQAFAEYINNNKVVKEEGYRPSWNTATSDLKWLKNKIFETASGLLNRLKVKKNAKNLGPYKQLLLKSRLLVESFGDAADLFAKKRAEIYSQYQTSYYDLILQDLLYYDDDRALDSLWDDFNREVVSSIKPRVNDSGEVEYSEKTNKIQRGVSNADNDKYEGLVSRSTRTDKESGEQVSVDRGQKKYHTAKDIIRRLNNALESDRLLEESIEQEWLDRRWNKIKNRSGIDLSMFESAAQEYYNQQAEPLASQDELAVQLDDSTEDVNNEGAVDNSAAATTNEPANKNPITANPDTDLPQTPPEDDQQLPEEAADNDNTQVEEDVDTADDRASAETAELTLFEDQLEADALQTQSDVDLLPKSIDDGQLESFNLFIEEFINHIKNSILLQFEDVRNLYDKLQSLTDPNNAAVTNTEFLNAVNTLVTILEFAKNTLGFTEKQTAIPEDIQLIISSATQAGKLSKPAVDYMNLLSVISPIIRKYLTVASNWYNLTVVYKRQIEGGNGQEGSYCISDKSIKLADVASEEDFILKSKFELRIQNTDGGKSVVQMIVHYNGMTFSPVEVHTSGYKVNVKINGEVKTIEAGRIFFLALRQLLSELKDDETVVAKTVRRTNGLIQDSDSEMTLEQAGFIPNDQQFEIEYSPGQKNLFGIVKRKKINDEHVYSIDVNGLIVYTFEGKGTTAAPGTLMYMARRNYAEDHGVGVQIPVKVNHSRFTEEDARLIVGILSGEYVDESVESTSLESLLDKDFNQDGMNIGMTRLQVLNLLLPYHGYHTEEYSPMYVQYNGTKVIFVGNAAKEPGQVVVRGDGNQARREFDMATDKGKEDMVQFLCNNVDIHVGERVLSSRMHDLKGSFGRLAEFMKKHLIDIFHNGKSLQLGNSRIKFSLSDIRDLGKADELGISGLVWYSKNGFITTRFDGFLTPLLSIDMADGFEKVKKSQLQAEQDKASEPDLTLSEKDAIENGTTDPKNIETQQTPVLPQDASRPTRRRPGRSIGGIARSNDGSGEFFADRTSKTEAKKKINVQNATKNLKRIIGNQFIPEWFIDTIVDVAQSGSKVLGRCWQDGKIFLSTLAYDGTEFHEAFHRVAELMMTLREHDRLYKAYRRAYKLGDNVADSLIAEMLADEFAFYVTGDEEFKVNHQRQGLFEKIKYWTDAVGRWNSFKLRRIYSEINSGRYAYRKPSEETKLRFAKIFGKNYADVKINGANLDTLFDTVMYRDAVESLTYLLVSSRAFNPDGSDLNELKIDKKTIEESILYKQIMSENSNYSEDTKLILKQMLDNFDAILPDVVANLSKYSGNIEQTLDEASEDAATDEDPSSAGSEQTYDRSSYEISPFNRASSKVKFFFSRLLAGVNVKNGEEIVSRALYNSTGLPFFFDAKTIYNKALIQLCECRDVNEMIEKCKQLGQREGEDGFMFLQLSKRLERLRDDVYKQDIKKSRKKIVNWDSQSFLTQIYISLRSTRNNFVTHRIKVDTTDLADHRIMLSDSDFTSYLFKQDWSDIFAHSGIYLSQKEDGTYVMAGKKKPIIFSYVYDALLSESNRDGRLLGLLYALSDAGIAAATTKSGHVPYRIRTRDYDGNIKESDPINVTNAEDLEKCKDYFISILNNLGIIVDKSNLNYYLSLNYGGTGYVEFKNMLQSTEFQSFAFNIKSLVNNDGSLAIDSIGRILRNGKYYNIDRIFMHDQFVDQLAKSKYQQEYDESSLQVYGVGRKRLYRVSENNAITDLIYDINRYAAGETNQQTVEDHMNFIYNLYADEDPNSQSNSMFGSIILKALKRKTLKKISSYIYQGSKSDAFGDYGDDYENVTDKEDALAKIKMLAEGFMCSPTMSDKKTWMFFSGIDMPGIKYDRLRGSAYWTPSNGIFSEDSLLLLLEYAKCEYQNALRTLETDVADSEKVDNYHRAEACGHEIIPGARLYGLSGIVNDKGEFISFNRVLDDNGKFVSERENLNKAAKEFFSLSQSEQLRLLANTLQAQVDQTILYCLDLGIISTRVDNGKELLRFGKLDSNDLNSIYEALKTNELILSEYGINGNNILLSLQYILLDLAVRIYLADVTLKQNISILEFDRLFAGHPAFYKTKYNANGELIDDTEDYQKRLGGLVSTGANNDLSYVGARVEYTAALIKDYKIASKHLDDFKSKIEISEFRQALKDYISENDVLEDFDISDVDVMSVDEIKSYLPSEITAIVEEIVKSKTDAFTKVNVTDGAAYMSPKMCEDLLKSVGLFTDRVRRAFAILTNPNKTNSIYDTVDAYRTITTTVIGAQKYTAFGFRNQNGVLIPYYDKMALFPIFDAIAYGRTKEILDQMKKQNIDVLYMSSAVKVGGQSENSIDLDKSQNEKLFGENDKLLTYTLRFDRLRKQFNTDPKDSNSDENTMAIKTLAQKIVYSSMRADGTYDIQTGSNSTKPMSRDEVVDYCMKCINSMSRLGEKEVTEKYFTDGEFDLPKFVKLLLEDLKSRGASQTIIDQLQMLSGDVDPNTGLLVFEDGRTGDKDVLALPLVANSSISYILSVIVSEINKKVIDVNAAGAAFYQRCAWGTEYDGTSVLKENDKLRQIYGGKELLIVNKEGTMDCVLSIDFFEHSGMLPKEYFRDKEGKRLAFDVVRKKLIADGIIGENAKSNIFGCRVPTQAVSSVFAFRCVDVMPVVRDTIIVPKEFTAVTGSDFDIDKIYLSAIEYGYDGNGKIVSDFEGENSRREYANKLIRAWISVLKDTITVDGNSEVLRSFGDMRGSIDSDTRLVRDVLDDLEQSNEVSREDPYGHYSLVKSLKAKAAFIMAKAGIGPFALNNVNHMLTCIYKVRFREKRNRSGQALNLLTELGLLRLDKFRDVDGNKIFSWLSGFINAHVDVAKDPYITRLNVNKYTWNILNLLIRTGYGKNSLYFINTPIIRAMANAINNTSKRIDGSRITKKSVECDAIIDFVKDEALKRDLGRMHKENPGAGASKLIQLYFKSKYRLTDTRLIKLMGQLMSVQDRNTIRKIAKSAAPLTIGDIKFTSDEVLLLCALAFKDLSVQAQQLGDMVLSSKIDTKKHGKNIIEQMLYYKKYYDVFVDLSSRAFESEPLLHMRDDSYIRQKTEQSILILRDICKNISIDAQDEFREAIYTLSSMCGIDNMYVDLANRIRAALLGKIKSGYFFGKNGYCEREHIDPKSLFVGDNSIYNTMLKLLQLIAIDPNYQDLKDASGNIGNYLLRILTTSYKFDERLNLFDGNYTDRSSKYWDGAKFIKPRTLSGTENFDEVEFLRAWEDLLNDDQHPLVQQFAKRLIVYAFMTSADNAGGKDIFRYVPLSWRTNPNNEGYANSYAQYMEDAQSEWTHAAWAPNGHWYDDIILNSWNDDLLVPQVPKTNLVDSMNPSFDGHAKILSVLYPPSLNPPRYIKYRFNKECVVYRRANGTGLMVDLFHRLPAVYIEVDSKGFDFGSRGKIYEYGAEYDFLSDMDLAGKVLLGGDKFNSDVKAIFGKNYPIESKSIRDIADELDNKLIECKDAEYALNDLLKSIEGLTDKDSVAKREQYKNLIDRLNNVIDNIENNFLPLLDLRMNDVSKQESINTAELLPLENGESSLEDNQELLTDDNQDFTVDNFASPILPDGVYNVPDANGINSTQEHLDSITFTESSGGYRDRTIENIDWSDVTISFYNDNTTLGEVLTERQAVLKGKFESEYLNKDLNLSDIKRLVRNLKISLQNSESYGHKDKSLPTKNIKLNIAGNGIYTLLKVGITQDKLNDYITAFIAEMLNQGITISEIRSGGQTGVDEAGIIAAQRLGIKASVHAPKGFLFRGADNVDVSDELAFKARFNNSSDNIQNQQNIWNDPNEFPEDEMNHCKH